jgi:prepilin-type processing-associated H-X9-DG protein
MIRFRCDCGKLLQMRDEHAGRNATCPACGREQVVPGQSIQTDVPRRAPESPTDVRADRPSGRPPVLRDDDSPRRSQPAATSGKATTSLVLGLLSLLCLFLTGIPAVIFGILGLRDIGRSQGRLRGRGLAITGLVTGSLGIVCSGVLPFLLQLAVQRTREAAARMTSTNNLKQIGLALHNYHSSSGAFPAHAIYSKDGKPLLSWRVALLPYVEQDSLYKQFRLDEPWDSPTNLPLLQRMPRVYALPGDEANAAAGNTIYQAIVGPGAVFDPLHPRLKLAEIPDGTSNTIFVAEAKQPVPWTKPDDLVFDPNGPLPQFSGTFSGGVNVLFVDGSVRFLPKDTPPATLKALITRNGGEQVILPP